MNLIDDTGSPKWGRLASLPERINWEDFDARSSMGKPRARCVRPFLFKHFDFYGALGDDFTLGCGLVRLGAVNSLFAYLQTPSGLHKAQFDFPLDIGFKADYRPLGETRWCHPLRKNCHAVSIRTPNSRRVEFSLGSNFQAQIELDCSSTPTLAMCTPIANTGFAYAQKTSGCPVSGEVRLNGKTYVLDPGRDGCYHDWTAGFLRRETFWNWACASGRTSADQPLVSLNLARGVNETGAHENVIWIDGAMHDLPLVSFEYDRDDVIKPWRVFSQCGAVSLRFTPQDIYHDHRQAYLLASRFNQCMGSFSGVINLPSNRIHIRLDGLKGWCEDHYAKW